jgi:acetyl-CoA C-acetyltransferase
MRTVIVSSVRTPIGKINGIFKNIPAVELGGHAIQGALNRSTLQKENIDSVLMGMVLQGGQGQLPSRQALRHAGLPWETKTETINKVCASGFRAITLADQLIRVGDEKIIIAGGMESMSQAPFFISDMRTGKKIGDTSLRDMAMYDGLTCSFTSVPMGSYGDQVAQENTITRQEQDAWALLSHQRAIRARQEGTVEDEIISIPIVDKNQTIQIREDESPRADTSLEKLEKLKPVFHSEGTITAGNAPGLNDGAAAVVLMSESEALAREIPVEAMILGHVSIALEAKDFPITPAVAIEQLLQKTTMKIEQIDRFEINEAFAAVALISIKKLKLPKEKVNVRGGAVAMGHPIGASGARIIVTLIHELKRIGGGIGIAAICSGGGQGDAILIGVPKNGGN